MKNVCYNYNMDTKTSDIQLTYELRPFPCFDDTGLIGLYSNPIQWVAYGVYNANEVAQLSRLAELTGRLPRRTGQSTVGYRMRSGDGTKATPTSSIAETRLLWDGEQHQIGLFEPQEIEFAYDNEHPNAPRAAAVTKLVMPLGVEQLERINALLLVDLREALRWVIKTSAEVHDNSMGTLITLRTDEIMQAIDVATCGIRAPKLYIPNDEWNLRHGNTSATENRLAGTVRAARAIARSGSAGNDNKELEQLIQEVDALKRIWFEYANITIKANSIDDIAQLGYENGIEGYVRAYLVDGVPLEDVLA